MSVSLFSVFLAVLSGYLFGSIPFGLVITRLAGLGDIRKIGSGNIGATNVLRTGRKDLALMTLLADVFKAGIIAYLFLHFSSPITGFIAGFFAVLGHNFPVWLHFRGGKGVASTLGMMLVMTPIIGILTCLTWLITAVISRYSSLSAMVSLCLSPIYALIWSAYPREAGACYALLAALSLYRHRENIQRLVDKKESKINFKKKAQPVSVQHQAANIPSAPAINKEERRVPARKKVKLKTARKKNALIRKEPKTQKIALIKKKTRTTPKKKATK